MDIETVFNIIVYVLVFMFGITIGSFLNVCILRLPRGESLITNNSHCMSCGTEIKRYDLIPVFSWLILRGKCRACGAPISPRYMIVEAFTGICFMLCYAVFPYEQYGLYFAMLSLFICGIIVLALQDFDTQTMCVSVLIYCIIEAAATVGMTFINGSDGLSLVRMPVDLKSCLLGAVSVSGTLLIIGFALTPLVYVLFLSQDHKDLRRLKRALKTENNERERGKLTVKIEKTKEKIKEEGPVFGFGMGDILMMAAGGLMLGFGATLVSAVIAVIAGAVYGLVKKATEDPDDDNSNAFAFGPFLAVGLLVSAYCGNYLAAAYTAYMFG